MKFIFLILITLYCGLIFSQPRRVYIYSDSNSLETIMQDSIIKLMGCHWHKLVSNHQGLAILSIEQDSADGISYILVNSRCQKTTLDLFNISQFYTLKIQVNDPLNYYRIDSICVLKNGPGWYEFLSDSVNNIIVLNRKYMDMVEVRKKFYQTKRSHRNYILRKSKKLLLNRIYLIEKGYYVPLK